MPTLSEKIKVAVNTLVERLNIIRLLPLCGHRCQRYSLTLLSFFLVVYCFWEFLRFGPDPADWDVLLISGVAAFIVGLLLVQSIPSKLEKSLDRLVNRGAFEITAKKLDIFKRLLDTRVNIWARSVGLIAALAMLLAFLVAFSGRFSVERIFLTIAEVAGAYIAGLWLGRMACYGQLGWLVKRESIQMHIVPGHVDGTGGLKPVGDFYFFQAMVVAIPAIFLAVWWLLIPLWPRYEHWREPYMGLLAVAITIEVLAFLVPIWSFHRVMQEQKKEHLKKADTLSRKINEIQAKLAQEHTADEQKALREQLSDMTQQYWAIEKMPTWPVDLKTRRRFGLNNFVLLLPLISNWVGGTDIWRDVANVIRDLAP